MRISEQRRGFSLLELMVVVAIILALVLEWKPNFAGVETEGRKLALEQQARTIDAACQAFHYMRGRFPASLDELVSAGLLDHLPRLSADELSIELMRSRPTSRDVAGARVVPR